VTRDTAYRHVSRCHASGWGRDIERDTDVTKVTQPVQNRESLFNLPSRYRAVLAVLMLFRGAVATWSCSSGARISGRHFEGARDAVHQQTWLAGGTKQERILMTF
jgi:hypothetical protein